MDDLMDKQNKSLEIAKQKWNMEYQVIDRSSLGHDNWLDLFKDYLDNCHTPIIELGCGKGIDTLYLIKKGKRLISCDYSQSAIDNIKKNFPELDDAKCFDMTKGIPFEDNYTDLIICGLCLHYFNEKTTFEILDEIKRVLKPNGILLFRVNSIKDLNFDATNGIEIEKHLFELSDGRLKRFFDEDDINKFFVNWKKLYLHEETIMYEKIVLNGENQMLEKHLWRGAMQVLK